MAGALNANPSREYFTKPALFSGGGGLVSTAMDYTRFAEMMLNGGELEGGADPEARDRRAHAHQTSYPTASTSSIPGSAIPAIPSGSTVAIVEQPDGTNDHALAKGEYWWYGAGGTWFGINPVQDLIVVGMIQKFGVPGPERGPHHEQAVGLRGDHRRLVSGSVVHPARPGGGRRRCIRLECRRPELRRYPGTRQDRH